MTLPTAHIDVALDAAKAAGGVLARYFEMTGLERTQKDDTSFVTQADTQAEEAIASMIRAAFPEHGFVGEEGNQWNEDAPYQWIVDPLDGTRNFVNGIPLFATSIALVHEGKAILGVIHNPVTNSLFAAEKGKGAAYNGKPITVSTQTPDEGVVTFGPSHSEQDRARTMLGKTGPYMKSARLLGCTALELAYVARGGTEGYICLGLSKWDYAAGRLLVEEAGGTVTDYDGNRCDLSQNYFIASNGVCHNALLQLVKA